MDTTIARAHVTSNYDPNSVGTFEANIEDLKLEGVTINYVSPFAPQTEGGLLAFPKKGNIILVCKPSGSDAWYYLGSTFETVEEDLGSVGKVSNRTVIDKIDGNISRTTGSPSKQMFTSNHGQGLVISEEYGKSIQNIKTEIRSTTRKKISLIDTPALDSISIDSGNMSRITLTDTPIAGLFAPPAQAVLVDSNGPQKLTCHESSIDIAVNDGKDINITNGSTGQNAGIGDAGFGNINLQSDTGDINLFTTKGAGEPVGMNGAARHTDGRIFLQCLNPNGINQVIQIETKGLLPTNTIRLVSGGRIEIEALTGNIDLKSLLGSINLDAALGVNIRSLGGVNIASTAPVNIDGSPINLNSGIAPDIVDAAMDIPPPTLPLFTESYYSLVGLPTYTNGILPL